MHYRTYKYRFYPNKEQVELLDKVFGNKEEHRSVRYMPDSFKWEEGTRELLLSSADGPIKIRKIRWSCSFVGSPTSITVSHTPTDQYYVAFCVKEDIKPLPTTNKTIGIDMPDYFKSP